MQLTWRKQLSTRNQPGIIFSRGYPVVLDWILYTGLTQLYCGIDMYNLLHKEQLHVSTLFIGHLQVDK